MRAGCSSPMAPSRSGRARSVARSLRLVSLAERAMGLQVVQVAIEGASAGDVTFEARMEVAGSGLELVGGGSRPRSSGGPSGRARGWRWPARREAPRSATPTGAAHARSDRVVVDVDVRQPGEAARFWRLAAFARSDGDRGRRARRSVQPRSGRARRPGGAAFSTTTARLGERWRCSDVDDRRRAGCPAGAALRHLPPDQRRESRRRARVDRRPRAHRRGVPRPRLLGHRDLHAAVLHRTPGPRRRARCSMYRYHTLPGRARARPARLGYAARSTPGSRPTPATRRRPSTCVDPDGEVDPRALAASMEHHISADVAYAVWQYWQATGDDGVPARGRRRDPARDGALLGEPRRAATPTARSTSAT